MRVGPDLEREIMNRAAIVRKAKLPEGAQRSLTPALLTLWRMLAGQPIEATGAVLEHLFHESRKWRFDVAWPAMKLAVELHGGTWTRGRHQRGGGFVRDREKMRAGVAAGWRVLEYTDEDLRVRPAQIVEEIQRALEQEAKRGE